MSTIIPNVFHHIPETLSYHLLVGGVIEIMAVVEGDGSNLGVVQQPAGIPPRHDVSLERDECVRNDYGQKLLCILSTLVSIKN